MGRETVLPVHKKRQINTEKRNRGKYGTKRCTKKGGRERKKNGNRGEKKKVHGRGGRPKGGGNATEDQWNQRKIIRTKAKRMLTRGWEGPHRYIAIVAKEGEVIHKTKRKRKMLSE